MELLNQLYCVKYRGKNHSNLFDGIFKHDINTANLWRKKGKSPCLIVLLGYFRKLKNLIEPIMDTNSNQELVPVLCESNI